MTKFNHDSAHHQMVNGTPTEPLPIRLTDLHKLSAGWAGEVVVHAFILLIYSLIQTYRHGFTNYQILLVGSIISVISAFIHNIHFAAAARLKIYQGLDIKPGYLSAKKFLMGLELLSSTAVFVFCAHTFFYLGFYRIIINFSKNFVSTEFFESIFYIIISWLILDKSVRLLKLTNALEGGVYQIINDR